MPRPAVSSARQVLLVCEEPRRGNALLSHLGLRGDVRRVLEAPVPSTHALFWVQRPVRWPDLEAQLRFTPHARKVVICHPRQHEIIELALREGASIVTSPDPHNPLADQVEAWLDSPEAGRVVAPDELANRMTRALERRLCRPTPHVRLADTARIDALVEKLAAQVLGEARGIVADEDDDWLDWENETTAVQPRTEAMRCLRMSAHTPTSSPAPIALAPLSPPPISLGLDPDLEETDPFARIFTPPPDLVAFDDGPEPEASGEEAIEPSVEQPLPAAPPPRRMSSFAVVALLCVMGLAGGFGSVLVFKDRLVGEPWVHELSAALSSTLEPG